MRKSFLIFCQPSGLLCYPFALQSNLYNLFCYCCCPKQEWTTGSRTVFRVLCNLPSLQDCERHVQDGQDKSPAVCFGAAPGRCGNGSKRYLLVPLVSAKTAGKGITDIFFKLPVLVQKRAVSV